MTLEQLGWGPFFSNAFEEYAGHGHIAGRIALEHKNRYQIYFEQGELSGELAGRMRHAATSTGELPAVGDWVAMNPIEGEDRAIIHGVLPRKSSFSRKAAGNSDDEQVVAANIDTIFLVTGLDANYNLRRIERYLTLAWESGANPVVVLNKGDLCDDPEERLREVESVVMGAPAFIVSAAEDDGIDMLRPYLAAGKTVALLGSSGVGKSTITNRLVGKDVQKVGETSELVGKGKHTTTHRELIVLPSGGMLIDTPGMREIGLWNAGEGLSEAFDDIERLALECRFRDCSHKNEPGCAVREAIESGELDAGRYGNYCKMLRELAYLERRHDQAAAAAERQRWKNITKEHRNVKKRK